MRTIEAWVNFPTDASTKGIIFGNYKGNPTCMGMEVMTTGVPRFYAHNVDASGKATEKNDLRFSDVNLFTGVWTHVVFTIDTENACVKLYVNGELAQTVTMTYTTLLDPANSYIIGGDRRSKNAAFCPGQIHSVAIYSDVRTADEVAADMLAPGADRRPW